MRRIARFAAVVAGVAAFSGTANAASLVFSSSDDGTTPGVKRVDMWMYDATRHEQLAAIQVSLDLAGASLAPGFINPNVVLADSGGNNYLEPDGGIITPWDLTESNNIGDPAGPDDVLVVLASQDLVEIDAYQTIVDAHPFCTGTGCAGTLAGLPHLVDRLYLGSFNINYDPRVSGVFLRVTAIFGEGDLQPQNGIDPIVQELRFEASRLDGGNCNDARGCRVEGLAPEPAGLALMGLALAGLGLVRRRS